MGEGRKGGGRYNTGLGNDFLDGTPKHRQQNKNRKVGLHET